MPKSNRTIFAVVSDTHGGHKLGLCNPNTVLERNENGAIIKYHPQISETQAYMFEVYKWGIQSTIKLAGKDDVVLIHNGDPTHGKASFLETMSTRMSDQLLIAQANIEEWLKYKNIKAVRFAIGTSIHELGEGSASLLIVNAIKSKYPKIDIGTVYHGLINHDGFVIDYAHHGPNTGSRKWLEGNEMRLYLRSIMLSEILNGNKPPNLVIRGHYHVYHREFLEIDSNGQTFESWMVLLPGFTFKDDYTRRATRSVPTQNFGMLAFEVIDGHLFKVHKFMKTIDIRTKEIL